MSFKDQIVKQTLESRQELAKQKTMYEEFYAFLGIEQKIINASKSREGNIELKTSGNLYFRIVNGDVIISNFELGSVCSVEEVLDNPKFLDFLKTKLEGFEVFKTLSNSLVIQWIDDSADKPNLPAFY